MVLGRVSSLLSVLSLGLSVLAQLEVPNTVYFVSNAETASLGRPGLSPVGRYRAYECLPALAAGANIGLIISCVLDAESGLCGGTMATATPLANSLGLTVDTSCGVGEDAEDDCVGDLITSFAATSDKAIAVVWDIMGMEELFENVDVDTDPDEDGGEEEEDPDDDTDPDDDDDTDDDTDDDDDTDEDDEPDTENLEPHHDLITTAVGGFVTSVVSQNCSGIDGQAPGTFRRSLKRRGMKLKIRGVSDRKPQPKIPRTYGGSLKVGMKLKHLLVTKFDQGFPRDATEPAQVQIQPRIYEITINSFRENQLKGRWR
ncbi:hypothetical protein BDZ94DRAFT_1302518 [Collybia nuda]|uniref:Uncharacterized protein n=1 Tax=Collybia nuda TaxID=64659 RepID=A0A9P6CCY7_9AGAR|nr:hypothetical protein BDZ94DRAFT_1302518 [Collybia nuda]